MQFVAAKMAPPFSLVSKFFLASVLAWVACWVIALAQWESIQGHYFQPLLLGLVHIATLGWITMIIFGAMYQLVPVILEVPLWSVRLGAWHFWIYSFSVIGLIVGFFRYTVGSHLDITAALVSLASYLFIFNIARTMLSVKHWNLTGYFLLAALSYFFLTVSMGLLLAINLGHPFISKPHIEYLKIHAHLGLVGWVSMVIMGVALKLLPMFAIAHDFPQKPAWFSFWLVNFGLLGAMVEKTFGETKILYPFYGLLLAAGLILYIVQIILILKIRLRKALDVAMKHAIVSFAFLFIAAVLGIVALFLPSTSPHAASLALAYGFVAIVGFISSLIVGEMYKVVPFLVWYHKYSSSAGIDRVPMLSEMINGRIASIEFYLFTIGVTLAPIAFIVQLPQLLFVGIASLTLSAFLFAYNILVSFRR